MMPKMEKSRDLQQNYSDDVFEARGFCSLCRRLVTRSFPKSVFLSEEEISRIMDQENVQFEPVPHVHVYWVDRNYCVRRVEGIRIQDDGLKMQTRLVSEALNPYKEGNVILLGENFLSSFNNIGGFLIRSGNTIIEAMPKIIDNSLLTKHSADQDITVSILPSRASNVLNLSEWTKTLARAIESCHGDVDTNCVWLSLSYGDANAGRNPVAVDEKILALLLSSKSLVAALRPEIKSLILSFSYELDVELSGIEPSFNLKCLHDEIEDMIKRVGMIKTFRVFFKLFNSRMLKIDKLASISQNSSSK